MVQNPAGCSNASRTFPPNTSLAAGSDGSPDAAATGAATTTVALGDGCGEHAAVVSPAAVTRQAMANGRNVSGFGQVKGWMNGVNMGHDLL